MAFKIIETQEQFDEAIKERLDRVKKNYEGYISPEALEEKLKDYVSADELKKYEGFMSPEDVEKKYSGYISPEDAKKKDDLIKSYEITSAKTKIAREFKLPESLADRIRGNDEDEMRKDAEELSAIYKKGHKPPEVSHEGNEGNDSKTELKNMLKNMKGE